MTGIEIRPGQVFQATIAGIRKEVFIPVKVQVVKEDGGVFVSPGRSRRVALVTTPQVLLEGGVLTGRLVIPPQIGGNIDTRG